jgi:hypothetical protein
MSNTSKSYSGQDLADLVGVEGITFRRYIRSDGTRVGRGKKYSFNTEDATLLLTGFLTGREAEVTDEEGNTETVKKLSEEQAAEIAEKLISEDAEAETEEEDDTEDSEDEETEETPAAEEELTDELSSEEDENEESDTE